MSLLRKFEASLALLALFAGVVFLLMMCHLSFAFNTVFGIVFLTLFYTYVRGRYRINLPPSLLVLVFLALQIDALGNLFGMYGQQVGPLQYDEFAHMFIQVLVTPIIVWLIQHALQKWGYELPLKLTAFFAATIVFSLSAFYEIIELWDEMYFHPHRIWGPLDTATDLQFDLCGIVVGTLLACVLLRAKVTRSVFSTSRA
ncbi:MAG TPA: hypothetical protein VLE19_06960 [Pyrinomonadaceae bacterium]|nr:hypothetical protein [Pyrinomonadaceae bacterium]